MLTTSPFTPLILLVAAIASLHSAAGITLHPTAPVLPFCAECKDVVGQIQRVMVNANKTYEDIIEKNLDENVCANLPAEVQDSCRKIVDEQIPTIWSTFIAEYLDPVETCQDVHLCPPSVFEAGASVDPLTCHICKKTAQFIDMSIFEDPLVQTRVATKLQVICEQLPKVGNSTAQCDKLIQDDTKDLMTQIGKAVAANMCVDLQLCAGAGPARPAVVIPPVAVCAECKQMVAAIQKEVKGEGLRYEGIVAQRIETLVCSKLPAAEMKECATAVEARLPGLWAAIISVILDPPTACRAAGFCAPARGAAAAPAVVCDVCTRAATFVDEGVFEDPEVQRAVAAQLRSVCEGLPNPRVVNTTITEECEKLVDDNTPVIMADIGKAVKGHMCDDLGVCAAA